MNRVATFAPLLLVFAAGCAARPPAPPRSASVHDDPALVAWIDVEGDAAHRAQAEHALRAEAQKVGGNDIADVEFHAAKVGASHYTATAIRTAR